MRHPLSVLLVLSSVPTCAESIVSEADVRQDTPSVIVVGQMVTSDASPRLRSIQQAVDQANAGDTILVKEGTYHETVTVRKKGITIAAFDPCHPPVIDGADPTLGRPSWEHVQGKVYGTAYTWYKPQLKREEFSQYGGGVSAGGIAMQVSEDDVLLRGYVGNFVDYGTGGYGAPYHKLGQLDPMSPMFHPDSWYKEGTTIWSGGVKRVRPGCGTRLTTVGDRLCILNTGMNRA